MKHSLLGRRSKALPSSLARSLAKQSSNDASIADMSLMDPSNITTLCGRIAERIESHKGLTVNHVTVKLIPAGNRRKR